MTTTKREQLIRQFTEKIENDGFIPSPFSEHFRWPQWAITNLFNPNRNNRDRYKLFVFILRNLVPDNIGATVDRAYEYMMFWVRHGPEFVNDIRGHQKHYHEMSLKARSNRAFDNNSFFLVKWWSLVEKRVIDDKKEALEPPNYSTTNEAYIAELLQSPIQTTPDLPPLPNDPEDENLNAILTELDFWSQNDPDDLELNEAYETTMNSRNLQPLQTTTRKKLRRWNALDENGNPIINRLTTD